MTHRGLRVGISALFDPADTPHARTFLRALAVARNGLPGLADVELFFADDGADPAKAAQVAKYFVDRRVDLVVGHFSSDAASNAAEIYGKADIPLLTPAATIDALTSEHHHVYRMCPPDRKLAETLIWLAQRHGWQRIQILSDDSSHGIGLAQAIHRKCAQAGLTANVRDDNAQATVYAGRLAESRRYWQHRRAKRDFRPLVLTDDAASPHLGPALAGDDATYVIGFLPGDAYPPATGIVADHIRIYGTPPETYFLESLAAFHIVAALIDCAGAPRKAGERLNTHDFNTPMGSLRFIEGERNASAHAVWRATAHGLIQIASSTH